MAKFNLQFDTVAKTLTIDLDGVPVPDVERVSFYEFDENCCCVPNDDGGDDEADEADEADTYRMEMTKSSTDVANKIRTVVFVCAADGSLIEDKVKMASLQLSRLTNANKK